jgi:hypothetical protein
MGRRAVVVHREAASLQVSRVRVLAASPCLISVREP